MSVRHPEHVWNEHKAAIQALYLDEDRKLLGPNGVVEEMAQKHGFCATKAQYERQFKKWNFSKNVTKEVWEAIAHKVVKRKRDSKESEVAINGTVISSKRLKKEMSRHGYAAEFLPPSQARTPPMSNEYSLAVYTPPADDCTPFSPWPSSLPWFSFDEKYLQGTSILACNFSLGTAKRSAAIYPVPLLLPSEQNPVLSFATTSKYSASKIACIMPEEYAGQSLELARSLVRSNQSEASLASLKVLLYAISNNLEKLSEDPNTVIWFISKLVGEIYSHQPITVKDIRKEPSSLALLERIQEIACNSFNLRALEPLLKFGMNPNRAIQHYRTGHLLCPIQIAAYDGQIELANLLLQYKSDVDAIGLPKQPTALAMAMVKRHGEICRLLLHSKSRLTQQFHLDSFDFGASIPKWGSEYNVRFRSYLSPFSPLSIIFSTTWNPLQDDTGYYVEFLETSLQKASKDFPNGVIPEPYLAHLMHIAIRMLEVPKYIRIAMQSLIRKGGNINTESVYGILPILVAKEHEKCMTLLSLGATVNLPETSPYLRIRPSLLHSVAVHGNVETVHALLELGADVNQSISLRFMDDKINCDLLHGWRSSVTVDQYRCWQQYHTPLQFVLAGHDFVPHRRRQEQRTKVANILLSHGATLSKGDLAGAVWLGNLQLVQRLHQLGASLDETSSWGLTPLEESIRGDFQHISRYLIESGARFTGFETPMAIRYRYSPEFIDFLRTRCGSLGICDLKEAFVRGNEELISEVLSIKHLHFDAGVLGAALVGINDTKDSIHRAQLEKLLGAYCKRIAVTQFSNAERIKITTSTIMAVLHGHNGIFNLFSRNFGALKTQACTSPFSCIADYFEDYRLASFEDYYWTSSFQGCECVNIPPLALATRIAETSPGTRFFKQTQDIQDLIGYGFKPDTLTLLYSAYRSNRDLLNLLFANGISPDQRYSKMDSPLQMAIRQSKENKGRELVQDLLARGAHVNAHPPPAPWIKWAPRTALQLAVECGDMQLARQLIEKGADINAPAAFDSGATALQIAAGAGFIGLAKMLIEEGADIDAEGAKVRGRTALEFAAEHGRIDMLQFLLDGVRKASTRDRFAPQYFRAIKFAVRNGHTAAVSVLKSHRAWSSDEYEMYEKEALEDESYTDEDNPFKKPFRDNIDQSGNRLDDIDWENGDIDDDANNFKLPHEHYYQFETDDEDVGYKDEDDFENTVLSGDEIEELEDDDELVDESQTDNETSGDQIDEDFEVQWQLFERGLLDACIFVDV